ncbi:hypothetical protein HTY54_15050 [Escherichia coli]|nr:hypothetical protein [Escherichia coli]MBW6101147.1 hypothetical protein [Escherichia coli]BDO59429.1 hypothetical protein TUM1887_07740 [Escherichia coli]GHM55973.1 hypothetical protein ECZU51_46430 [Escherichia coli]HDP6518065.1 hypothetical protein [Escherichia coli]
MQYPRSLKGDAFMAVHPFSLWERISPLVIEVRLTAQTAGNSADSGIPDGNYHSRQGW